MKKLAIVGASAALAAMPVLGVFAVETDTVKDSISITVKESCNLEVAEGKGKTINEEMNVGTVRTDLEGSEFTVACNTGESWTLSAKGSGSEAANALNAQGENEDIASSIAPASNLKADSETSDWGFKADAASTAAKIESGFDTWHQIPSADTPVAKGTAIDGTEKVKITYGVAIGNQQKADTYTGQVTYTLAQP